MWKEIAQEKFYILCKVRPQLQGEKALVLSCFNPLANQRV